MNNHGLFFRVLCFLADCIRSGWACRAEAMRFARSENVNVESVQRFLPVICLNFSPVTDKQTSLQLEDKLANK
jgi:hypothetical protein